jgi:hypothetical protein
MQDRVKREKKLDDSAVETATIQTKSQQRGTIKDAKINAL